jgi:hypothetical protein
MIIWPMKPQPTTATRSPALSLQWSMPVTTHETGSTIQCSGFSAACGGRT